MAECDPKVSFTEISHRRLRTVEYLWKIENFSYMPHKCGQRLTSGEFSATKSETDVKWHLAVYPKGELREAGDDKHLAVYLHSDQSDVVAKLKFALLGAKRGLGQDSKQKKHERAEEEPRVFVEKPWGYAKFIKLTELQDEKKGLLPGDTLNLLCEVTYAAEETVTKPSPIAVTKRQILTDFEKLFDDGQFSDCKILVGDVIFKVHKLVLMARSDVFAAMFQHALNEQRKGVITITDIDSEVVRELLRFIYTDTTTKLTEMSEGLLRAAEKYQLERLKQMCEGPLYDALTVENACDTLLVADTYRADQLKTGVEQFLKANLEAVRKTEGWKRVSDSQPRLLLAAFRDD